MQELIDNLQASSDVLGEVLNLAVHGRMYLRERELGHAMQAFLDIVEAIEKLKTAQR